MLILANRVKETTTSVGTGTITLAGAVTGYQGFSVIGNANTTYYCIAGQSGSQWEVGIGTYTSSGTTLSRDTILSSSSSGSAVDFSAGTKDVFVVYPSEKAIYNGGPLGTPSSGTVTNLTGTASININGTVGFTTPNTGAFTTLSATGNVNFDGGTFVFNDAGADKDFRVEGDTDANLLFTDASTDRAGIGTNTPSSKLTVAGVVESTTGGFKFPDSTTQTTAGIGMGKAIAAAIVFG